MKDTYNTIETLQTPILFKEKSSKFYGYAFFTTNETEIKQHLAAIKGKHHTARHWCYAYQLGTNTKTFRVNDDGEPSNSAGMPIYGQLQAFDVTNTLIVIVRYFGGVKLGVGGLIQAYKTTAKLTLEASTIVEKTINVLYTIVFEYKTMNKVMRLVKTLNLNIISQHLELNCTVVVSTRKNNATSVFNAFSAIYGVQITTTN